MLKPEIVEELARAMRESDDWLMHGEAEALAQAIAPIINRLVSEAREEEREDARLDRIDWEDRRDA